MLENYGAFGIFDQVEMRHCKQETQYIGRPEVEVEAEAKAFVKTGITH